MTYLDYINNFWQKDLELSFTADEVNIYFRLLKHANALGWKPRFNLSVEKLMAEVSMKTKKPFDTARKGLRDAGLLEFKNGNGRGCTTEYQLIGAERVPERDMKNTPLSGTLSDPLSGTLSGEVSGLLHKTKIKNKNKGASAPASEQKEIASLAESSYPKGELPAANTGPDFQEFWDAYGKKEDTKKCKLRWQALTPEQRQAALAATPAYVAAKPDKKYRKNPLTWLNGECWQDELPDRSPNGTPQIPKTTRPAGASTATTVALNQDFEAELQDRERAEAQERIEKFRAAHIPAA